MRTWTTRSLTPSRCGYRRHFGGRTSCRHEDFRVGGVAGPCVPAGRVIEEVLARARSSALGGFAPIQLTPLGPARTHTGSVAMDESGTSASRMSSSTARVATPVPPRPAVSAPEDASSCVRNRIPEPGADPATGSWCGARRRIDVLCGTVVGPEPPTHGGAGAGRSIGSHRWSSTIDGCICVVMQALEPHVGQSLRTEQAV